MDSAPPITVVAREITPVSIHYFCQHCVRFHTTRNHNRKKSNFEVTQSIHCPVHFCDPGASARRIVVDATTVRRGFGPRRHLKRARTRGRCLAAQDPKPNTPWYSVYHGCHELDNETPCDDAAWLCDAIENSSLNTVHLLIARHADATAPGTCGLSPLTRAARQSGTEPGTGVLRVIAERVADPGVDALDGNGCTALMCAARWGTLDAVALLVRRGARADLASPADGSTPLHFAVARKDPEDAVCYLLQHGADPGAADSAGATPLVFAAQIGAERCCEVMLAHAPDAAKRVDWRGDSALHHAARKGHQRTVQVLLRRAGSALLDLANKGNLRAQDVATGPVTRHLLRSRGWSHLKDAAHPALHCTDPSPSLREQDVARLWGLLVDLLQVPTDVAAIVASYHTRSFQGREKIVMPLPRMGSSIAALPDGRVAVYRDMRYFSFLDLATAEHPSVEWVALLNPIAHNTDHAVLFLHVESGSDNEADCHGDRVLVAVGEDRLAVAGATCAVDVYSTKTYERKWRLEGHAQRVRCLAAMPDGRRVASGSLDGTVRLWDARTGKCLWTLDTQCDSVTALCALQDGVLAVGTSRGLLVWDAEGPAGVAAARVVDGAVVAAMVFLPEKHRLVCHCEHANAVFALDTQTFERVCAFRMCLSNACPVRLTALANNHVLLADSGGDAEYALVWRGDVDDRGVAVTQRLAQPLGVSDACSLPDGRVAIVAQDKPAVLVLA